MKRSTYGCSLAIASLAQVAFTTAVWAWPSEPPSILRDGNRLQQTLASSRTQHEPRRPERQSGRSNSLEWLPDVQPRLEMLDDDAREAAERRRALELPGKAYRSIVPPRPRDGQETVK